MPPLSDLAKNAVGLGLFYVVADAMRKSKSFDEELGFYGSYHQNPWNQLIHFVFIPTIWWSICVFMCYIPVVPLELVGLGSIGGHRISFGTFMLLLYSAFYVKLDFVTGGAFSLVLFAFYLQASSAVAAERAFARAASSKKGGARSPRKMSWFSFAFVLHALAWYMQIHPGHGVFEGVKPALMDSLGQALGVAPLFAFLEGLWFVGVAPELQAKVLTLVGENRAAMCAAGKAMPWC